MDACVEILVGLIRIGPDCHKYWDPYEHEMWFTGHAGFATLKGLIIPQDRIIRPDGTIALQNRYTTAQGREIKEVVEFRCREIGMEPIFDRAKRMKR